jgi:endoglucanase
MGVSGIRALALGSFIWAAALPAGADSFERNARLGRGVNFGNALEAPKKGDWGLTLKEEYFKVIAEAGFRSVRIPIKWSTHAAAAAPYAIDAAFFARIDWAVAQSLKNGLAAVINIHHYDEMATDPAAHKARWLGLWKQIAEHYKDQGTDVYFELLNEPNSQLTMPLWNRYLAEGLAAVRASNPARAVIVGPSDWNGIWRLKDLSLPAADQNLIVTVHYYNPFHFTHQGAEWAEGSAAWLGTKWGTQADQDAVAKDLKEAMDWSAANQRPIYMGEFGAYSKADMASRALWTRFVARTAEKDGFSWAYWEFGSGFGVYDPAASQWRTELKNALMADPLAGARREPGRETRALGRKLAFDKAGRPASVLLLAAPRGQWTDVRGRPVEIKKVSGERF